MTARSTWPVVRLGDYVDLLAGFAFKSSGFTDNSEDVPLVKGDNVQQGYIDWRRAKRWPREASTALSKFRLASGDVVLAMDRPWVEAGLKLAWVKRSDPEALLVQRVSRLRGVNGLDTTFMRYVLCSQSFTNYIRPIVTGINVPHISPGQIRDFKFILPPLAAQRHIASILSAYDDLIENNTRRIAILEEMPRRIYEEWFVRFRFPGHEQVKRVESELGLIPEGWKVQTVEQTFQILGGGTPSKAEPAYWEGGTINWYSPTDLTRAGTSFMEQSADRITALGLAKSSAKLFPPMSVMLTSRATIGVVAINTNEACTNQGFITCLPNSDYPLWLLYHWLKANVETFIGLGTGATFKEITKGTFKGIRLLVPQQNLVGAFSSTSEQLMLLSLNLQRKNRNLRATRDLLLPKLISGELDVSTLSEPTV